MYTFAVDIVGEGVDAVCERVRAAGVSGISLAVLYHEARDYLPHNPLGRVHFSPPGVAFQVREAGYPVGLRPPPPLPVVRERGISALDELVVTAADYDLTVDAWVLFLHNDGPAGQEGAVINAFGDEHKGLLCLSGRVVRAYLNALIGDVCRPGLRSIVVESLHWFPFEHGFHHERCFAPLSRLERFLLSLCFCSGCREYAEKRGDPEVVAEQVRALIGTGSDVDSEWCRDAVVAAVPDLDWYLRAREDRLIEVSRECAMAARDHGVGVSYIDLSAGLSGWSDGSDSGPLGVDVGWELGIDVGRLDPSIRVTVPLYTSDPARVRKELDAYRQRVRGPLDAILRPMAPDFPKAASLAAAVDVCSQAGVGRLSFYHYGMMPLASFDSLRQVMGRSDGVDARDIQSSAGTSTS